MDRLFLDANVLYSAAESPTSRFRVFWDMGDVELVTSVYAQEEARRNLDTDTLRDRLADLAEGLTVIKVVTLLASKRKPLQALCLYERVSGEFHRCAEKRSGSLSVEGEGYKVVILAMAARRLLVSMTGCSTRLRNSS